MLLGVAGAAPRIAAPPQLPVFIAAVSYEHHLGKVILVELVTPALAAALSTEPPLQKCVESSESVGRLAVDEIVEVSPERLAIERDGASR